MPTIYISDSGDDKNDGLSLKTAIYSLKRAKELHGGRNDYSWHFGPRAWKRIQRELSEKKKKKATRATLERRAAPSCARVFCFPADAITSWRIDFCKKPHCKPTTASTGRYRGSQGDIGNQRDAQPMFSNLSSISFDA